MGNLFSLTPVGKLIMFLGSVWRGKGKIPPLMVDVCSQTAASFHILTLPGFLLVFSRMHLLADLCIGSCYLCFTMRRLFWAMRVWISLEAAGTCQWTVLWVLVLPDFGTCMPEPSVHGWPAETGQEHSFRSSGAQWDCWVLGWKSGMLCPRHFLPDAAPLQLYNLMERSWLQRRKTSEPCCCWKQLSLLQMEKYLMDQKTVF